MKNLPFTFVATSILLFTTSLHAQYNPDNLTLKSEMAVEKFSYDKLRIYPITANRVFIESHKNMGHFKPLKAGLEDGTVKIIERGALGDVDGVVAEEQEYTLDMFGPNELLTSERILAAPAPVPIDTNYRNADGHVVRYQEHQAFVAVQEQVQQQLEIVDIDISAEEYPGENDFRLEQLNNPDQGASDEVNQLFIQNNSSDSVFIMAGEVIKGGKQDRVIAMDMVIPPHSEPVDMSVYCVEHGRWTYGGNADELPIGGVISEEAPSGKATTFYGYSNVSNSSVRKAAIVDKDQSKVWSEVADVTTANHSESATGTLNALEKNEDYQKELEAYSAKFGGLPQSAESVIGVVAVTGDRVIGCDMFATPDLFRNAFPDLLKSYASEAITSGAAVTISQGTVDKYISKILDESKQKEVVEENGQMYRRGVRTMHISTF